MCGYKMPPSNTHLNVLDLCRLCLGKDNSLSPVFDKLSHKISVCLSVEIKKEDEVSQKICNHCLTKVDSYFDFRNTALECQKVLHRWASEADQTLSNLDKAELSNKNTDKDGKERLITRFNKTSETDESDIDYDSRSDSESSNDGRNDDDANKELSPLSKSLDYITDTTAPDVNLPEREVPGTSCVQPNNEQSPLIELSENEEKPNGNKRVANKALNACEFCGQSFTEFKLRLHRRKHTGERPFKCSEPGCDWAFASKGMLSAHRRAHSSNRPYVCDSCSQSFKTAIHLKNHIKIHTGEKPHYCDLCDYSCLFKASLIRHHKRHLKDYSVICEICGKGFYSASDLKEHVSGHTGETPFACNKCDQKFPNKYFLRKHKIALHNTTSNSNVAIQCEKCSRICPDKISYKNHVRRVHANKKYECDICGKLIVNKSYLAEHMRIHSGEKPYTCGLCGKSFIGRKSLKMHEVVHTGEKKYECKECGKKFTQKSSLNAHKKLHISNS